ncbi:MAG: hypothetical protein R3F19_11100 [Verrucomicrobiales bacterium]
MLPTHWRERGLQVLIKLVKHPIFPVIVFTILSTFLYKIDPGSKGEFYPFSNYPMYANPRERDLEYFFLEHGDGTPLASFAYTGYTASRVKKLMRSESMAYAKANGLKWNKKSSWLTDEVQAEIGTTVLAHLRKRSQDRATPFPGDIALARGIIFVSEDGMLEESAATIARNAAPLTNESNPAPAENP